MRFKLLACLVALLAAMPAAYSQEAISVEKPAPEKSEAELKIEQERAEAFAPYDKEADIADLKKLIDEVSQKLKDIEPELKQKEEPLHAEIKIVAEEYKKQAEAVEDHARKMPGVNATQAEIAAYDKESDKLNEWGKDLNARRDDFKKELDEIWQPYDALEEQHKRLQARLTKLERFNERAKNCKTQSDLDAATKCLDTVWNNFNTVD